MDTIGQESWSPDTVDQFLMDQFVISYLHSFKSVHRDKVNYLWFDAAAREDILKAAQSKELVLGILPLDGLHDWDEKSMQEIVKGFLLNTDFSCINTSIGLDKKTGRAEMMFRNKLVFYLSFLKLEEINNRAYLIDDKEKKFNLHTWFKIKLAMNYVFKYRKTTW